MSLLAIIVFILNVVVSMCLTPCPRNIWSIFEQVLNIKLKRECWICIGVSIGRVMVFQYECSAFISIQCFLKCWWWCSLVINGSLWLDQCLQDQDLDRLSKCCLWWLVSCNQKALRIWNFQLLPGIVPSYLHLGKHRHLFHYWSCCLLIRYDLDLVGAFKGGASLPRGIHSISLIILFSMLD